MLYSLLNQNAYTIKYILKAKHLRVTKFIFSRLTKKNNYIMGEDFRT